MKYSGKNFELSRADALLVGLQARSVEWDELYDLWVNTWVAFEKSVTSTWRCLDASLVDGVTLVEAMMDEEINSFDAWPLGKLAVFLERIPDNQL